MATALSTDKRIRAAAVKLFAERGYAATGIRDLADETGIGLASLYHHIGTKENLLVSLMLDGMQRLVELGRRAVDDRPAPEHRLVALVQTHVFASARWSKESIVSDTELRSLSADARERIVAVRDSYERLWDETFEAGRRARVFRIEEPHLTRLALIPMCTGVVYWYHPDRGDELKIARTFADVALAAVHAARDGTELTSRSAGMPDPRAIRADIESPA